MHLAVIEHCLCSNSAGLKLTSISQTSFHHSLPFQEASSGSGRKKRGWLSCYEDII